VRTHDAIPLAEKSDRGKVGYFGNISTEILKKIKALIRREKPATGRPTQEMMVDGEKIRVVKYVPPEKFRRAPPEGFIWHV